MKKIKSNAELVEAIRNVVAYNWNDEEQDFRENPDMHDGHIFTTLKALDQWCGKGEF